MRIALRVLTGLLLAGGMATGWANGGGGMPSPPPMPREQTPQQKARDAYNDGVHDVKKADKAQAAAAEAPDAGKKDKAAHEAGDGYTQALRKFQEATGLDPQLPGAWNYVGYTSRKLGHYEEALAAYDRALTLKPGYADALEYRGEAYLALNRVPDAQQAYLDLYAGNRALAGKLLTAMKNWVPDQRPKTSRNQATNLDSLNNRIQDRAQIAGQNSSPSPSRTAP